MFLLIIAGARDVAALTITVAISGDKQLPSSVVASFRRVDGEAAIVTRTLSVGVPTVVDGIGEGTWETTVASSDFWAAPAYVTTTDAATLLLWPLGSLGGKVGGRAPASGEFVVTFEPSHNEAGPVGIVTCPFRDREWLCALPTGVFNLRVNLTGFATEFRWGITVRDHASDNVALELTPGSSLSGEVQLPRKSTNELLKSVELSLRPINVDPVRDRVRQYMTTPDARGFFQLRGLAPGSYVLDAQAKGLISEAKTVEIIQGTNASLKDRVVLAKPAKLSLKITPAVDPIGKRWTIQLLRMRPGATTGDQIAQSSASSDGEWELARVLPGQYRFTIEQEGGSVWKTEQLELLAQDGDRFLDIALTPQRVTGSLALGKRPIAGTIHLGGEQGPKLIANDNGDFEGVLPSLPEGEISLFITSDIPYVRRTVSVKADRSPDGNVVLNVRLPATSIYGRTINEDGSAVPSAIVTLSAYDGPAFEQLFPGQDGSFQFEGFEPGRYVLQASAFQKSSDSVDVEVGNQVGAAYDLVLRAQELVRGRVTMNGVPVAGADVYAFPRDTKFTLVPEVRSDSAGLFEITLPPGTGIYDAVVIPRGFYMTTARVTRVPKEGLNVGVGQDGGSLIVDAPDDGAMLLLAHAGSELSLSWVAQKSGGSVSTDKGRKRVTVLNLESGTYAVCRGRKCASVFVPRFATSTVTIDQ